MDLTKLTDADVDALASGKLTAMSDAGFNYYHDQLMAGAQPPKSNSFDPAATQEAKYKAIAPGAERLLSNEQAGGPTVPMPKGDTSWDKIKDPNQWAALGLNMANKDSGQKYLRDKGYDAPNKYDNTTAGAAPLALPAGAFPTIAKTANYLMGTGPRRIATSTAAGAVQDPEHPIKGGVRGFLTGIAGEGASAIVGGVSKLGQSGIKAAKLSKGSVPLQDEAQGVMGDAIDSLRGTTDKPTPEQSFLNSELPKHEIELNPNEHFGKDPKADTILEKYLPPVPRKQMDMAMEDGVLINLAGEPQRILPDSIKVPATDAYELKKIFDKRVSYNNTRSRLGTIRPEEEGLASSIKTSADSLRGNIHNLSSDISDALTSQSAKYEQAEVLNKQSSNPLTALASENLDAKPQFNRIGEALGGDSNIASYSADMRGANKLRKSPVKGAISEPVRGAWNGRDATPLSLLQVWNSRKDTKKDPNQ